MPLEAVEEQDLFWEHLGETSALNQVLTKSCEAISNVSLDSSSLDLDI